MIHFSLRTGLLASLLAAASVAGAQTQPVIGLITKTETPSSSR